MTTLPEHLVEGVYDNLCRINGEWQPIGPNDIKEVITAALPFLPVQGAVKKLEWNEYEDEQGIPDRWDAEASSFGVFYSIEMQHDGYRVVFDHEAVGAVGVFDTLEAAKSAAQADYEARILSALEPSAGRAAVLEELVRAATSAFNAIQHYAETNVTTIAVSQHLNTAIEAALRALSSPVHADAGKVEGDGWLPIETAPKDRTSVIIAVPAKEKKDGFIVGEAYFDPENYEGGDWWWAGSSHTDHFDSPISDLNYNAPTNWRPLPSAPSEGSE